ncbi:hypothetical protein PROFUN_05059 [Planoprotostelium fungivorum]|uniref:Helicase-associated domain-containing protein n=1 Tax=Planoprotostelium fungivorum TaxID=1890364 RepID=A0A2P6NS95_9EUKA|nr:hypothetical protein PROFUN_05059 [Planoprotostelium fungivorum]
MSICRKCNVLLATHTHTQGHLRSCGNIADLSSWRLNNASLDMHKLIHRFMEYPDHLNGADHAKTVSAGFHPRYPTTTRLVDPPAVQPHHWTYSAPPPPVSSPPKVIHEDHEDPKTTTLTVDEQHGRVHINRWMANFRNLKQYKQMYGTTNVTRTKEQFRTLGNWVHEQRRKRRNDSLSAAQIQLLDSLNFDWVKKRVSKEERQNRRSREVEEDSSDE